MSPPGPADGPPPGPNGLGVPRPQRPGWPGNLQQKYIFIRKQDVFGCLYWSCADLLCGVGFVPLLYRITRYVCLTLCSVSTFVFSLSFQFMLYQIHHTQLKIVIVYICIYIYVYSPFMTKSQTTIHEIGQTMHFYVVIVLWRGNQIFFTSLQVYGGKTVHLYVYMYIYI